jgi:hypothetical protein
MNEDQLLINHAIEPIKEEQQVKGCWSMLQSRKCKSSLKWIIQFEIGLLPV